MTHEGSAGPGLAEVQWRCFHCDEVFTDKAEAREHFGDYLDDSPLCLIKGEDGGLAKRVRELEAEVADVLNQRNEYENDARLWHESEADRRRRIGNVQWWQELDSKEGERLVLAEEVTRLHSALRAATAPQDGWQPIETCPREATRAILYWPAFDLDEEGNLTDHPAGEGLVSISYRGVNGVWEEVDPTLEATGEYFGDSWEYGTPTLWHALPPFPAAPQVAQEGQP